MATPIGGVPTPGTPGVDMEWLMQQHAQQQELNARLMRAMNEIQASLQTPRTATDTVPSVQEPTRGVPEGSRRPKHILAHPNKFDGQDRTAYKAFKGYLKVNGEGLVRIRTPCGQGSPAYISMAGLGGRDRENAPSRRLLHADGRGF